MRIGSRLARVGAAFGLMVAAVAAPALATAAASSTAPPAPITVLGDIPACPDGLGICPGKIKHVWLIILENKSYDATFTGINKNTYLWRTLPSQGALLKGYYGTGHFSLDNYISLVSGQATEPDTQFDCPFYALAPGHVDQSGGSLRANSNYGQFTLAGSPNGKLGSNGCVYPSSVKTLFNQFDSAGVKWKTYLQDLSAPKPTTGPPRSAGVKYCGAPYSSPGKVGTKPNPQVSNATNQYLPKHNPLAWFESVLGGGHCDSGHVADLFSPTNGQYHDLQSTSTTPTFSWITPDMCSDGHDAVCYGNNLSGGFTGPNTVRPPVNWTGGLYSADLFLRHVVPMIEASPAFRDGGLIDITFDEAFPACTYTGNSFANIAHPPCNAASSILSGTAGQTLYGKPVHYQPQGPNTPLRKDSQGRTLWPGDGNNSFVDRNTAIPGLILGGGGPIGGTCTGKCLPGGARTDVVSGGPASPVITDRYISLRDVNRSVTDTVDPGNPIPAGCVISNSGSGRVVNSEVMATAPAASGGYSVTGTFTLLCNGKPTKPTGAVTHVNLGAQTASTDPLFDLTHSTNGGGNTGSVLISPYIRPGSVSTVLYNHYSWLRTMEDLFSVGAASKGLDGKGHLGYAAQPGLATFGHDVFTNPAGYSRRATGFGVPLESVLQPAWAGSSLPVATSGEGFGVVPAWLGEPSLPAAPIETGTRDHPWLAVEGDTVRVRLSDGSASEVLATAVGPSKPGTMPKGDSVPCTFEVTVRGASGSIPLNARQFAAVDENGVPHPLRLAVAGGGSVPSVVTAGGSVQVSLSADLPAGGGRLLWAPDGGANAAVAWDYTVEVA